MTEPAAPARVALLLPSLAGGGVERNTLSLARGLLGRGVAASTRFDPQGKAVGEWLRGRTLDILEDLL